MQGDVGAEHYLLFIQPLLYLKNYQTLGVLLFLNNAYLPKAKSLNLNS